MYFVNNETSYCYEEKKSKFIAYLMPYKEFDKVMKKLRDENPKARHFVYAYRYLNEFNQIVENSSDDGEPRGTSGKPTLNVLAGNELINSAIITIRYFGGIKLGTGGLVRAYSDAANLVIENSKLIKYENKSSFFLKLDYGRLSKIEYIINELDIEVRNKSFTQDVVLELLLSKEQKTSFEKELPRDLKLYN